MNGWRSIGASALLAVAAGWAPVHAAGLGVCRADAEEQLTPTCREAIAGAGPSEVVALIEPWIAAQNYVGALRVLQEARRRHPSNATLQLREHEVQSLADEAAWVARGRRAEASRPDDELALTQTRCLGLTGEAALAACEKALQSKPDEPRLLVARGDLLLTLGRTAEAPAG